MTIGERLRQAREAREVTLHAIAEKTNISVRFLDAIEKGQIDKLPGGIFTRGFVRSYATQVGLDPDETVRAFVAAHPQVRNDDEEDETRQPTGVPVVAWLVAALVIAAVAAGLYWWLVRTPARATSTASGPRLSSSAPAPTTPATLSPQRASPVVPAQTAAVDNVEAEAPAGQAASADAAAAMPSETPAPSTRPLRLTLAPSGRCWVQVKADGRVLLAREVVSGERVDIEASEQLEIVAGDAGAFGYQINGRPGRSLGAAGRVGRATITTATLSEFQER